MLFRSLLGSNHELLVADFGHSTLLKGKKGDGKLSSKLGTPVYNAPEVGLNKYDGKAVDIFMAGVVLFIFITANTPFKDGATKNDQYYKNFMELNPAGFWSLHEKRLKNVDFNSLLKDLLSGLFSCDPAKRPSLADVAAHPWLKQPTATEAEVKLEMQKRLEAEEEKKEKEKKAKLDSARRRGGAQKGSTIHHNRDVIVESDFTSQLIENRHDIAEKINQIKLIAQPPMYENLGSNFFNTYYSSLTAEQLLKATAVVANNLCNVVTLHIEDYTVLYSDLGKSLHSY